MRIPYVIDNGATKLGTVLGELLASRDHHSFDVATAYFNLGAFQLLQPGLQRLKKFRLLIGADLASGDDVGLKARDALGQFVEELNLAPYAKETVDVVDALLNFLNEVRVEVRHQPRKHGFLHAKCYLFYGPRDGQQELFCPIRPVVGIVGSSNFTRAGLTVNSELNTVHQVMTDELQAVDTEASLAVKWLSDQAPSDQITPSNRQLLKSEVGARAIMDLEVWFNRHWNHSDDFKPRLIEILKASKFGTKEYSPWLLYLKALYEYFKEDLEEAPVAAGTRSAVELASFQEDAVHKARRILDRYDGVMVADSVGLGKTWIGKKLLEDYAYHLRQKALVVCPASLRGMWERTLSESTIAARVVSQESLAMETFDLATYADVDVVLVDESHNFRNARSQRYEALEKLLGLRGGVGAAGLRRKVILLTATPINNTVMDLYHQINLIARNDPQYFQAAGIGDLFRYFVAARRGGAKQSEAASLFNLLEEVVIRRTRSFIRETYPEALVNGKVVKFPERSLSTERYDLETVFEGLYGDIVDRIGSLTLAPYNLDSYRKDPASVDEMTLGRAQALVGIFKSRFLKRLESSVEAFRKSVRRALEFQKTFRTYLLEGRLLNSSDFRKLLSWLARDDEDEDDAAPPSRMVDIEANDEAREFLESLPTVDLDLYDRKRLRKDVDRDVEALTVMWKDVCRIGHEHDAKYTMFVDLLARLKGQKVLVFSYYRDTARYLYRRLREDLKDPAVREALGAPEIQCLDSTVASKDRLRVVERFAPHASDKPEFADSDKELDVLIATDVLSEGHNLQDCAHLVNYDLHWNPTRMVQRAGRIDRIGSRHDTLVIHNVFPEAGLEKLLGLVQSLSQKIEDINRNGFLDASVLGETVSPRTFNTLQRIRDEDGSVLTETEGLAELASPEGMLQVLRRFILEASKAQLEQIPDGIRSCRNHPEREGFFFYFQSRISGAPVGHFWRFVDAHDGVQDNRLIIGDIIACDRTTPRESERADAFVAQEKAIEDILRTQQEVVAREEVPRELDPVQKELETLLKPFRKTAPDREVVKAAMEILQGPLPKSVGRDLKKLKKTFEASPEGATSMAREIVDKAASFVAEPTTVRSGRRLLAREDLYLVCFEEVIRGSTHPARPPKGRTPA